MLDTCEYCKYPKLPATWGVYTRVYRRETRIIVLCDSHTNFIKMTWPNKYRFEPLTAPVKTRIVFNAL